MATNILDAKPASQQRDHAPAISKNRPTQIPCLLLARLAVDKSYTDQNLGWELLRDALLRSVHLSESIGAAAVLVHCRDEEAKRFYLHNDDFIESPVDDLHLLVSIKSLAKALT